MNCFKPSKVLILLIFIIPFVVSFGQEEEESQDGAGGDAGGDTGGTAAETAVTGSASQPTTAASGATEGNPLVVAVRSGAVSVTDALTLGVENIRKVAAKGGDFKQQVTFVDAAVKKGFDFTQASDLIDAGVEEVEALENLTVGSDLDTTILNVLSDENLQSLVLASAIDVFDFIILQQQLPNELGRSRKSRRFLASRSHHHIHSFHSHHDRDFRPHLKWIQRRTPRTAQLLRCNGSQWFHPT